MESDKKETAIFSSLITNKDKKRGAEIKLEVTPNFNGPIKRSQRRLTDPFCLVAIIALWISVVAILIWCSLGGGNPFVIIYPNDYSGQVCGYDKIRNNTNIDSVTTVKGEILPKQWYTTDVIYNGICIKGCPNITNLNPVNRSQLFCKEESDIRKMPQCLDSNGDLHEDTAILTVCGACMYMMESTNLLNHCFPKDMTLLRDILEKSSERLGFDYFFEEVELPKVTEYIERFGQDILISWRIILTLGLAGTSFLSFLTLYLIRFPGFLEFLVWISCCLTPILFCVGGGLCYILANDYHADKQHYINTENQENALRIIAYILWVIGGMFFCILIFLRKRINLAVGITKASIHALTDLPMTIFYPILQIAAYIGLVIVIFLVMLFVASMRSVEVNEKTLGTAPTGDLVIPYTKFTYESYVYFLFWYILFVFFWSSEYVIALGQITLGISFSRWYFAHEKGAGVRRNIFDSMSIALFKHSGTAAFGSLIISIVTFIRAILMYIYKKLKQPGTKNICLKVMICSCSCCLVCVEKILKFINKNAYIQTAIFGYNFCKAAREAFFLILRNAARITSIGLVSQLTVIFFKIVIVVGIGVSSFFTMQWLYFDYMWSILSITVLISFMSWFVANMFMEVLGIAIATILQCFIADEEMYPEGSYFVPNELDSFLKCIEKNDSINLEG